MTKEEKVLKSGIYEEEDFGRKSKKPLLAKIKGMKLNVVGDSEIDIGIILGRLIVMIPLTLLIGFWSFIGFFVYQDWLAVLKMEFLAGVGWFCCFLFLIPVLGQICFIIALFGNWGDIVISSFNLPDVLFTDLTFYIPAWSGAILGVIIIIFIIMISKS